MISKARLQSAAAAFLFCIAPTLALAQGSVDAVWASRHVSFVYQGFTTHYSCDGLREAIREMLAKLGAQDLKIREFGCTRFGVEPFPGVRVTMRVLAPVSSTHDHQAGPVISAHWQNVVLMPSNAGPQEQGKCELIEQFKETFLPLFTTRHIDYQSNCIPHQLTLGTHLGAEVLMPDARPAPGR